MVDIPPPAEPADMEDITSLLSNAQEMGRRHPDTFNAQPTPEQLDGIRAGDSVKICVPTPGERFWCIVKAVHGDVITGEINNELVRLEWPLGKVVKFNRECVYSLLKTKKRKKKKPDRLNVKKMHGHKAY